VLVLGEELAKPAPYLSLSKLRMPSYHYQAQYSVERLGLEICALILASPGVLLVLVECSTSIHFTMALSRATSRPWLDGT
jgi:hypothetical protein